MINRRTSCEYVWNSDASGPCVLRPIKPDCYDSPASNKLACGPTSTNWTGIIDSNGKLDNGKCKKSKKCGDCNDKNIAIGGNTPKTISNLHLSMNWIIQKIMWIQKKRKTLKERYTLAHGKTILDFHGNLECIGM